MAGRGDAKEGYEPGSSSTDQTSKMDMLQGLIANEQKKQQQQQSLIHNSSGGGAAVENGSNGDYMNAHV